MLNRILLITLMMLLISTVPGLASPEDWFEVVGGVGIGARPGNVDGYDGQTPISSSYIQSYHGIAMAFYRQYSPSWPGPTGFYTSDFESPIPPGGSKTWPDIYLWAQNPTVPIGGSAEVTCTAERRAPAGYTATLVLDYVPASLNYTGPMAFPFPLHNTYGFDVPTPTLDFVPDPSVDGDRLTRMHVTVTAPVPEPSSLLALGMGGLGMLGMAIRRRRSR